MKFPIDIVGVLLILFYIVVPLLIWLFARDTRLGKTLVIIFAILFAVVLFFGITSIVSVVDRMLIIDIDFTYRWCDKSVDLSLLDIDTIDFLINISMLIPIGLVVAYFSKKKIWHTVLTATIVGLIVGLVLESLQFILPV